MNFQHSMTWLTPTIKAKTSTNTTKAQTTMSSSRPQKRARAALHAESEESSNDWSQKRPRVTSAAQIQGSERGHSRITTSRFSKQQQRQPALNAYNASGTTPAYTHSAIGQRYYPSFPGHQSRSSSRASYSNNSQLFDPSSTTDARSTIPQNQTRNTQFGSGFSSLQAPTARYDHNSIPQGHVQQQRSSNGYTELGVPHPNQGNSHSYRPSYLNHTNNSTPNTQNVSGTYHNQASGYYNHRPSAYASQSSYAPTQVSGGAYHVPESGYHTNTPSAYASQSSYASTQVPSKPHISAQHYFQPTQPTYTEEWLNPPQPPILHSTNGKRKRANTGTSEQQQHPTKRAKGSTTTEAATGQVQNPSDFMLGADYLAPTPDFQIPTPRHAYGQMDTQTVPHPVNQGSNMPPYSSSQNPYPPAHADPMNAHDPSFQAQQPAVELDTLLPPTQQHGQTDTRTTPHPAAYQGYTIPSYSNPLTSAHVDPWTGNFSSYQAQPAVDMPDNWQHIYPATEHLHPQSDSFF